MVVLILVALWIVVLAPAFLKSWLKRQPGESIDSFHHQLHLLERAGPKIVAPAYRLETATAGSGRSRSAPRAFLGLEHAQAAEPGAAAPGGGGPVPDGDEVVDEVSGEHFLRIRALPATGPATPGAPFAPRPRRRPPPVAARPGGAGGTSCSGCRDLRLHRAGGFVPALHGLWYATMAAGGPLVVYVGMMMYAAPSRGPTTARPCAHPGTQERASAAASVRRGGRAGASARAHGPDWSSWPRPGTPGHGTPSSNWTPPAGPATTRATKSTSPEGRRRELSAPAAGADGPGGRSTRLTWSTAPGGVAQLVERYVRNVEVGGSSPLTSTGFE